MMRSSAVSLALGYVIPRLISLVRAVRPHTHSAAITP
jgi:hypothetical protein